MVTKVNGGVYRDQNLAGTLRAFKITAANVPVVYYDVDNAAIGAPATVELETCGIATGGTADLRTYLVGDAKTAVYELNGAVPNSIAEQILRIVSTRATIVSVEFAADSIHVLLENASGWDDGMAAGFAGTVSGGRNLEKTMEAAFDGATAVKVSAIYNAATAATYADAVYATVDLSGLTCNQCKLIFVGTDVSYEAAALGGNEHN